MKFKCIPGAFAHEMKLYIEPTLETKDFKAALLQVDINDKLKIKSSPYIGKVSTSASLLELKKVKLFQV